MDATNPGTPCRRSTSGATRIRSVVRSNDSRVAGGDVDEFVVVLIRDIANSPPLACRVGADRSDGGLKGVQGSAGIEAHQATGTAAELGEPDLLAVEAVLDLDDSGRRKKMAVVVAGVRPANAVGAKVNVAMIMPSRVVAQHETPLQATHGVERYLCVGLMPFVMDTRRDTATWPQVQLGCRA